MPTHYDTLGLKPSASSAEIKRAYRALAKSLHPDVNPAADAAKKFARISAAYEIVSDPARRAEYDRQLAAKLAPPIPPSDLRQGHYAWVNVAGRPSEHDTRPDISEIDELYDTFFGPPRGVRRGAAERVPSRPPKKPPARRGKRGSSA